MAGELSAVVTIGEVGERQDQRSGHEKENKRVQTSQNAGESDYRALAVHCLPPHKSSYLPLHTYSTHI